ncbi:Dabb family protein [Thermodesulfobacteriota bacterium]
MIHHVVMFKFKPDVQDSEIEEFAKDIDALPDKIVEIQALESGLNIFRSERSYDFALISVFANMEALQRYQNHPDHLLVISKVKEMCSKVGAVDFETEHPKATE